MAEDRGRVWPVELLQRDDHAVERIASGLAHLKADTTERPTRTLDLREIAEEERRAHASSEMRARAGKPEASDVRRDFRLTAEPEPISTKSMVLTQPDRTICDTKLEPGDERRPDSQRRAVGEEQSARGRCKLDSG
jgi:hypothetical protein